MTHKALIIEGPEDGKEVEISGAFYVVRHPDGATNDYEYRLSAYKDGNRLCKWYFLVERGVTEYLIGHPLSGDCAIATHLHEKVRYIAAGYSEAPGVVKVTKTFYGTWP